MKMTVLFSDMSVLEVSNVINTRKVFRYVSKHCNYWRRKGYYVRVIDVIREF